VLALDRPLAWAYAMGPRLAGGLVGPLCWVLARVVCVDGQHPCGFGGELGGILAPKKFLSKAGLSVHMTNICYTSPISVHGKPKTRMWTHKGEGMPTRTIFEALGGAEGVLQLAQAWHEQVLADEIVAHAFSHGFHPHHTRRLAAYWGEVWGGPPTYTEQYGSESSVIRIHSGNGRHEEMDRCAIACFDRAMDDVKLIDPLLRRVLHDYFTWATTSAMAAYPKDANDVPEGLCIPQWSWDGLQV
jgi:hemoglobin